MMDTRNKYSETLKGNRRGTLCCDGGDPWRVREDLICVNGYVRRDNYISTSYRDHQKGGGRGLVICRDHCSGEGCLVHVTGTTKRGEGGVL